MKKTIAVLFCLMMVVLSGCCLVHDWSEPDCTEPSVCSRCGAVRGEAPGHDWEADAGLLICRRCGLINDPYAPADEPYEETETTETVLEVPEIREEAQNGVISDFEKYGIVTDMVPYEIYPFTTGTENAPELLTTGELAVTYFGVLPEDSTHKHTDGYEWRCVIMQATFFDANAKKHGVKVMPLCEDYYDIRLCGSSQRLDSDGYTAYTVTHNGREEECRYKRTGKWSDWYTSESGRREIIYSCMWEIQIPGGYDGTVVGLYSSATDRTEGSYLDEFYSPENFRLFRIG